MFSMKLYPVLLIVVFLVVASSISAGPSSLFSSKAYHSYFPFSSPAAAVAPDEFGIKEVVPKEFLPRYQKWKDELLATEYGRKLWDSYATNREFLLTIKISSFRKFGA